MLIAKWFQELKQTDHYKHETLKIRNIILSKIFFLFRTWPFIVTTDIQLSLLISNKSDKFLSAGTTGTFIIS